MNIANIKPLDIANGPGIRVSVFVSGCTRKCPGCFNEEAQAFDYGQVLDLSLLHHILDLIGDPHVQGMSLLGGEPFEPNNQKAVLGLVTAVKNSYPEKDIWCYTGYTLEELLRSCGTMPQASDILRHIDVLVDGPFVLSRKDLALKFRGSDNQRIIDVPTSLEQHEVRLWYDHFDDVR